MGHTFSALKGVKYYANCEISISWWRLLQIAKPVDYFILWGRSDSGYCRKSPESLPVLLPRVWVRPKVVTGEWLTGHVFICGCSLHIVSLWTAPRSSVQANTRISAFPVWRGLISSIWMLVLRLFPSPGYWENQLRPRQIVFDRSSESLFMLLEFFVISKTFRLLRARIFDLCNICIYSLFLFVVSPASPFCFLKYSVVLYKMRLSLGYFLLKL